MAPMIWTVPTGSGIETWRRLTCLVAIVSAIGAFAGTAGADAGVEVPFAAQFSANVRGGVAIAADTLMTCPAAEASCPEAQAGTAIGGALNNNNHTMERVRIDPATLDSSSAALSIPAGATVRFAGLYYGARTSKNTGGEAAPEPNARGTVLMRTPGAPTYSALTATVADSTSIKGAYVGFVDVTAQVTAAGSGDYTVANVQSGTGVDRYAGWSLCVVYADPASPARSIQVFNGLASIVSGEAPLTIPISGLETPPTGTVTSEVGIVAYEGDRGAPGPGDRLLLAGRELSDAVNPPNNVFNSTIALAGRSVTTKNPNYDNQLGFDADLIQANGFLGNGVTETTLEESTGLEQYLTQAIVVAVELNPTVLEPPPLPPEPPAPSPPAPGGGATGAPTETGEKDHRQHHRETGGAKNPGHGNNSDAGKGPAVTLEATAPGGTERPSAVVPVRVTVEASGGGPVTHLQVCNTLSPGLTRLQAVGATKHGDAVVCWQVAKLPRGMKRTFVTTARVDATARRTLLSRTVVRGHNARTVRRTNRIQVVPLPPKACGSSLSVPGPGAILRRC